MLEAEKFREGLALEEVLTLLGDSQSASIVLEGFPQLLFPQCWVSFAA